MTYFPLPEIADRWNLIRQDRSAGARELLISALDILSTVPKDSLGKDIEQIISELEELRPEMAGFRNAARLLRSSSGNIPDISRSIVSYLRHIPRRIGESASHCLGDSISALTISRSSTVAEVIQRMHTGRRIVMVNQLESQPGGEGVTAADVYSSTGIPVELYPDTLMAEAVDRSDVILVGADSVGYDGVFLGKTGCRQLAILSGYFGKPYYVVAETLKITDSLPDHNIVRTYAALPDGSTPELHARSRSNYYLFEYTPGNLVAGFLTERGLEQPPLVLADLLSF